jgi:predicted DNA-binding transcriptional regulator AlpA
MVKTHKGQVVAGAGSLGAKTVERPSGVGRRFLSYADLRERGIRFSRVHLGRMERTNQFPKRVVLGSGSGVQASIAWLSDEVLAWEEQRITERGAQKPSRPSVMPPTKRANEADAPA